MAADAHRDTAEWGATILGKGEPREHDKIIFTRYKTPRLTLEVTIASIRGDANQQGARG
jgi:hypothetical protein